MFETSFYLFKIIFNGLGLNGQRFWSVLTMQRPELSKNFRICKKYFPIFTIHGVATHPHISALGDPPCQVATMFHLDCKGGGGGMKKPLNIFYLEETCIDVDVLFCFCFYSDGLCFFSDSVCFYSDGIGFFSAIIHLYPVGIHFFSIGIHILSIGIRFFSVVIHFFIFPPVSASFPPASSHFWLSFAAFSSAFDDGSSDNSSPPLREG